MAKKSKVYPTSLFWRFLTWVVFTTFSRLYNIRCHMPAEVRKLKPPYLVLGNHIGLWDPFVTGNFLPHFTHFVASDAAFRSQFMGFFLKRLGAIPVKKNMRDTKVIRDIIAVIRKGHNVGIFPEAVRNWAGTSFPLDISIAKLIKLLKVPVVSPVMKGMNLFNPRWSRNLRRARVDVHYTLLLTPEKIAGLSESEILEVLKKGIYHDEVDFQRKALIPIRSTKKAEHISHALYLCPECKSIDSFRCSGNEFLCEDCGYDIAIDRYGFFARKNGDKLFFDNIRDWYYWQEGYLINHVKEKLRNNNSGPFFRDEGSRVFSSNGNSKKSDLGEADISLFHDRISFRFRNGEERDLNFNDLKTINPQVNEELEIYYGDEAIKVVGARPGVSALKWEVAMNAIWRQLGQSSKLSPYIKSE
jgi:1-acyl-sn-glycerol-3-phosphate acyltransferase